MSVSVLLALLAGCSSTAKPSAPVAATSAASSDAATPGEPSPTVTQAPNASTPTPGTVVLDRNQLATVCNPAQTASADSTSSTAGSIAAVLTGAVAIISCGTETVGYDLNAGQILWQHPIATDSSTSGDNATKTTLVYGSRQVYAFESDTVPADGLIAAYPTAHLTAYDTRTGQVAWTQPVEAGNKKIDVGDAKVIDVPAKADGKMETIVSLSASNIGADTGLDIGLDSATGTEVWRRAPLEPGVTGLTYLGYNLAMRVDGGDPLVMTGLDVASGRQAWQRNYQASDLVLAEGKIPATELIGHTVWLFAETGYDTFDLTNGSHTAHVLYPVSFKHVLSTTTLTMAYVDNSLRLFRIGKWSKPLWSVTSDDATPLAVSDSVVLVSAASGPQLLSAAAGTVETTSLTAENMGSDALTVGDGFAYNTTTVIALGGKT